MWRANGTTPDGQIVNIPLLEIVQLDSRDQLLSEARHFLSSRRGAAVETLARELASEDPLPGIDGIDTWGEKALQLMGRNLVDGLDYGYIGETQSGREIQGLRWVFLNDRTVFFHFPEAIIADVSGLEDIEILGEVGITLTPGAPPERLFLEWRAYLGTGTLVAEGETELEEFSAPLGRLRRARLWLENKVGFLIGRIVCIIGKPRKLTRDDFYFGRLRHYEARHPEIVKTYPDLYTWGKMPALYDAPPRGPMIVFVHGAYSCSLPNLASLHPLRIPTFRFEHDTFLPITENAEDLSDAIAKLLQPNPLHLVAHSRGGLVARLVARKLSKDCRIIVRTYGTPHRGTPLANAGDRAWRALLAMGRTALGGIFSWDPASLAGKLILRSQDLPPGLSVMRTDSQTLDSWTFMDEPFELISYGGAYDKPGFPDGVSAYTFGERVLHEAFGGMANDLVVPTASAIGAGEARKVEGSCDHFSYFSRKEIQDELRSL